MCKVPNVINRKRGNDNSNGYNSQLVSVTVDYAFLILGSYTIEMGSTETDFIAYRLFLISKEKAGLERALGGSYFSRGNFNTSEDFFLYAKQNILGKGYLDTSMILMPEIILVYNKSIELKNRFLALQLEEKRSIIVTNTEKSGSAEQGQKWFQLMTEYIDVLYLIQEDVGKTISNKLKLSFKTMQRSLYAKLAILIMVIAGIPVLCVTVFRMTSTIQKYAFVIARKTKELHEEKKRADALLYQMFPKSVADQLKRKQSVSAEHFESVTVYFSDIVGFTKICSSISPMQVTFLLNTLYGALDELIEKYDVYKVETIGDAYMVVSGLPNRNGNDHAVQICNMALNIMEVVETFPEIDYIPDKRLSIRAGIHTGEVLLMLQTFLRAPNGL